MWSLLTLGFLLVVLFSQAATIRGRVASPTGEALLGATVLVRGRFRTAAGSPLASRYRPPILTPTPVVDYY